MPQDRFDRLRLLIGDSSLEQLRNSHVAVFGVGGVGSHAVEALVRSGVGKLTLVDFDHICLTNINRHIHALDNTVGYLKVEIMAERCWAINPRVVVETRAMVYDSESSVQLLADRFDYVLDCIDMISAKLHLIQSCHERHLPVISSMGAANKLDPTQLQVADISMTKKCRLARTMRKELRKRGVVTGVEVVFSTEEFRPLVDGDTEQRNPLLGSSSSIPPLFGLTMAATVIRNLIGDKC